MKHLVLAEKPSAAREFAAILGCRTKGNGYFEGNDYIVTWALGHLITLKSPEEYGDKYKTWSVETLPMLPERMETKVIPESRKQFYNIKELAKRNDVSDIIIATDAGREGELVARLIMEHIGWRKPFKRLWISSLTPGAIKDGFKHLKPGQEFENLYRAAKCRSEADWLIGLNVTRSLTIKYNDQLSAGRVQTPTLAMIVKREKEIRNFRPVPFWTLEAMLPGFTAHYIDKENNSRIFNKEKADELKNLLSGKKAVIKKIVKKQRRENPPSLYDLTELQREANKRYAYTAQKTLKLVQSLYEYHKIVSYPRTSSRYISDDMVSTLDDRLKALPVELNKYVKEITVNKMPVNKDIVNNSKVTDHHALVPTEEKAIMTKLSGEEVKIYNLIAKRFLENFYPPAVYEQLKAEIEIGGERFIAEGTVLIQEGWKKVDGHGEKATGLPPLKEGQEFDNSRIEIKSGQTQPPPHHTEASLLSEMEKHELGTPATRAEIIEKIININYVERKERSLIPTPKGIQIVDIVVTDLRSPDLTAKWEKELEDITKGKKSREDFMKDIVVNTKRLVRETLESEKNYKHDNLANIPCPECGKDLLRVKKKDEIQHVCSDRNCRYRKVITKISHMRCTTCHKEMEIREGKSGTVFFCRTCNTHQKIEDKGWDQKSARRELARINKEGDKEFKMADNPFASLKEMFK